jgi:hypothetical protein
MQWNAPGTHGRPKAEERTAKHLCALANGDVPQHGGTSANEHIVLDLRVAVARIFASPCSLK